MLELSPGRLISSGTYIFELNLPQGLSLKIGVKYKDSDSVQLGPDCTPSKIESSLYQDFHVLYVHIERDKKHGVRGQ